jgi:elongator complex protein 3
MDISEILIKYLTNNRVKTQDDLARLKRDVAKRHKIPCPSNIVLLKTYHESVKKKKIKKSPLLESLLKTRPVRSLSGIVNISVLTKPYPCPGKCLYCPAESGIPKSYVSGEPAVERAKKLKFNPYLQVKKRIEMLEAEGHPTDKIELRIVGGTWSYYPKSYQNWFVKKCIFCAK